jgi:hypothetical protein
VTDYQSEPRYGQVIDGLRQAYDHNAEERDRREISNWKIEERAYFLSLLQKEGVRNLLELGAGTGWNGKFFQDSGLAVVCTDLSLENVGLCQAKGLGRTSREF